MNVAARMGRGKPALSQPRGLRPAIEPDRNRSSQSWLRREWSATCPPGLARSAGNSRRVGRIALNLLRVRVLRQEQAGTLFGRDSGSGADPARNAAGSPLAAIPGDGAARG